MHGKRRTSAATFLAVCAMIATQLLASGTAAHAVTNSVQDVFRPGTATSPSTHVEGYGGPLLSLQAVKVGMTASEPTLGVAADGTAYFAASTLDVERSQFWGVAQTHTLRSSDGGLTWQRIQQSVPAANVSFPPGNLDPFVWVDQSTSRVFNLDLMGYCSWLNYSDDRGDTWTPVPAACGMPVNDHQTIVGAKPTAGVSTMGYPNVLYYCANQLAQTGCGRSLDGGTVWTPTLGAPYPPVMDASGCGSLTGHLEADNDGRVFLPNGGCDNPWLAISEDGGDSWSQVKVNELGSAVSHTSVAADAAGNLYYASLVPIGDPATKMLPFLTISRDHGQTWGAPIMIAPPGVTHANFPVVSAGDEGKIAINFPATSVTTILTKSPWNQYMVVSDNALSADPIFLSATANDPADPVHRGPCLDRCGGMWDFLDLVISPAGEAWGSASDDCIGACATSGRAESAHVGDGIAIRQVGGPRLRG
jgi:hypothetical protein